jgi:tetratricopeptide (TPR) repeat protein
MKKKKKFYKKRPKKQEKELPSISRNITEKAINDHSIFFIGIICILAAIALVLVNFYKNLEERQEISEERTKVIKELNFWNKEVIEKPEFRDGYFSLSLIYYQLGDLENLLINLEKAMEIDPNFEKGKELKGILEDNF